MKTTILSTYFLTIVLFALSGCGSRAPANASFWVLEPGGDPLRNIQPTLVSEGSGWGSETKIEILAYGEPRFIDNEVGTTDTWRSVGFANTDKNGNFTMTTVVERKIPGAPPMWMRGPLFQARDTNTGLGKSYQVGPSNWFTYKP